MFLRCLPASSHSPSKPANDGWVLARSLLFIFYCSFKKESLPSSYCALLHWFLLYSRRYPPGRTSHAGNNIILSYKGKWCLPQIHLSPTGLLWKPKEVRVWCPAQKQTSDTHGHTPSIQPSNFILQMHNTSYIWTAVTKQTWTQRPSQTNPLAEPCGGRGEPVWRTEVFISGDFTSTFRGHCLHVLLYVFICLCGSWA